MTTQVRKSFLTKFRRICTSLRPLLAVGSWVQRVSKAIRGRVIFLRTRTSMREQDLLDAKCQKTFDNLLKSNFDTKSIQKIRMMLLLGSIVIFSGCASRVETNTYKWKEFVNVKGHRNAIPKEWIATPEGRFAHDLIIPNPVSADSGYVYGMNAVDYYLKLCDKEAGEFTFKTVENVDGLYFARPPVDPTDDDMKDRWKLEHPWLESKFQLVDSPSERATRFVAPPWRNYKFVEEPNPQDTGVSYFRMSGYQQDMRDEHGNLVSTGHPMKQELVSKLESRYGMIWRGIHRPFDRENGIAGGEIIIYNLHTNDVLYVFRNFAFSGRTKGTPDGVWWLNSGGCQRVYRKQDPGGFGLAVRSQEILKVTK